MDMTVQDQSSNEYNDLREGQRDDGGHTLVIMMIREKALEYEVGGEL